MDFFFCLPILFGCPTKLTQEGDGTGSRVCPRCHNASVFPAKSRTWFEVCFVPLIPMSSKHVWVCGICQWEVPQGNGYEPPHPGMGPPQFWHQQSGPAPGWENQQGYGDQQQGYGYQPKPN